METPNQTVYITKYATTKGILELPGTLNLNREGYKDCASWGCLRTDCNPSYPDVFHYNDGYLSKEDAIADACKRRDNKIKSLRKQIEKLENMTF